MKVQRDKLQQYQKKLSVIAARETEIARECIRRGDKKKALVALRRKKYQENLIENTDKHLEQLEMLVNDVEFARVQQSVLYGLQQGTVVLKMMQKEMGGIEGVERLLSESEDAQAYVKVRLRLKWKWRGRKSDLAAVGGERNISWSHDEPRGGRGRGRIGQDRTRGQWYHRGESTAFGRGIAGCPNSRTTGPEYGEAREVGEEAEGAAGGGVISVMTDETNWEEETIVG
jgi:Snf7